VSKYNEDQGKHQQKTEHSQKTEVTFISTGFFPYFSNVQQSGKHGVKVIAPIKMIIKENDSFRCVHALVGA
jgi:hypothetical protein